MKPEKNKPFSHVVPNRRDRHGDPIPTKIAAHEPLLSLDGEAMVKVGEMAIESVDKARKMEPWLRACNAVASEKNNQAQRQDIADAHNTNNDRLLAELKRLRPELKTARRSEEKTLVALANCAAKAGVALRLDQPCLRVTEEDLPSLEALAARHGLDPPSDGPSRLTRFFLSLAGIGVAGCAVGIGLALLTGQVELAYAEESWAVLAVFAVIGVASMASVHAALTALCVPYGARLSCAGAASADVRRRTAIAFVFLAVVLAIVFVLIEATTEQAGLLRAVVEQSSLETAKLGRIEAWLVSLIVSLPSIASCALRAVAEGMRLDNMGRLQSLQANTKKDVESSEHFVKASGLYQSHRLQAKVATDLAAKIEKAESELCWEPTEEDRERAEDGESDTAIHSYRFEESLFRDIGRSTLTRFWRTPWWRRFWRRT